MAPMRTQPGKGNESLDAPAFNALLGRKPAGPEQVPPDGNGRVLVPGGDGAIHNPLETR